MRIKRVIEIDIPLAGDGEGRKLGTFTDEIDVEEAVIGFRNFREMRREFALGLRQHGVHLLAGVRMTVELTPLHAPSLPPVFPSITGEAL